MKFIVLLISVLYYSIVLTVNAASKSYEGYSVWQVKPMDSTGLIYLNSLLINGTLNGSPIDFWKFPSTVNGEAEIMVNKETANILPRQCSINNIQIKLLLKDVNTLIKKQSFKQSRLRILQALRSYDFSYYPSIGEITNKNTDSTITKPAIWIDGGIHAREWISPATVLYTVNKLLTEYTTMDRNLKKYVDNLVWYFLPVMNPDGYAYTETDRMWRKNRRPTVCTTGGCCSGVDLNRNFDYMWSVSGSSAQSCSEIYHGSSAFSEPESIGVRNFILANKNQIKVFLTVHSFGQLWMIPFGASNNARSSDYNDLLALGNKASQALQREYGTRYTVGNSAEISYLAAGTSSDWAKASANIKYSYTIELRPGGTSAGGTFLLPADQILPSGQETWRAFRLIADELMGQSTQNVNQNFNKFRI